MPTRRVLAAFVASAALLASTASADDTSTLDRIEVTALGMNKPERYR